MAGSGGTRELVVSWGPRYLCIVAEAELLGRLEEGAVGARHGAAGQPGGSGQKALTFLTTVKSEPKGTEVLSPKSQRTGMSRGLQAGV